VELTDVALDARLFAAAGTRQGHRHQVESEWVGIQGELERKHVTVSLCWHEYIEAAAAGLAILNTGSFAITPLDGS
jgi:hypothetical protein